jgi:hypothetical protein
MTKTKVFPPIIATFHTEAEARAFVRGVEEGLEYSSTEWLDRITHTFGLLNGEWRVEICLYD